MKKDEVPQDANDTYKGVKKLLYAKGDDGSYEGVASEGWEPDFTSTEAAVAEFERRRDEAHARAKAGQTSELEYYMLARRLDVPDLAMATGFPGWRVKRHFKPATYAKLPDRLMARYADVLGHSIAELRTLPDHSA